MRTRSTTFLALFLSGTMAAGVALAADGDLDPTFSSDGKATTAIAPGTDNDIAYAMALQWDGKIVVAGTSSMGGSTGQDISLVRYKIDGSLDPTFSSDGKATLDFFGGADYAEAVAIQWDGKIVVAGAAENTAGGTYDDFAIARYNTNGTLDKTFSGDGKVSTAMITGANPDGIEDIALQPDGKIVVVGYALTPSGPSSLLVRYNTNGTLDKTFSGDGIAFIPSSTAINEATSVELTSNGKILVAGSVAGGATGSDLAVLRFTSRGALDRSFGGGDGIAVFPLGSEADVANAMAVGRDGKIVVAGVRGSSSGTFDDVAVVRLLADGTPDGSFGFEGIVATDVGGSSDAAYSIALQWDGKAVVAGKSLVPDTGTDATVLRYNSDGTLDATFGEGNGIALASIAPTSSSDWFEAVAIQWNGKIVGAGTAEDIPTTGADIAAARFDAKTNIRKSTSLAPSALLRRQLPTGASVKITVAKTTRKVCTVSRGKLKTLKAGTCRATISVTPRRGRTVRVAVSFTVVD